MKNSNKSIYLLIFLLSNLSIFAQDHIAGVVAIYGKVESSSKLLDDYSITVVKNNKVFQLTDIDHKKGYRLNLTLDGIYSVTFEKNGYLTKSVIVNGLIDSTLKINRATFQMDIDLVSIEDFMQDKFCLLPVAKIYYDDKKGAFTFDKSYTKEMLKLYDRIKSNNNKEEK